MAMIDDYFFDRFMESDRETTGSDTSSDDEDNMSGQAPKKITKEDAKILKASQEEVIEDILNECFFNIIHDIVTEVHREEKILRMKSAAIVAEEEAKKATAAAREAEAEDANGETKPSDTDTASASTSYVRTETEGAVVEPDGTIRLKGNPLKTTPTVICPQCRLPRLQYPTAGARSRPPPDPNAQYCTHKPFVSLPGHDVYGNPFATDKVSNRGKNSKKKQQEEKGKGKEKEKESQASSPSTEPSTPLNSSFKSNGPSEKVSFPTLKCPNPSCSRYLLSSRIAQHLDKCLGITGRQSSRNAMTKMSTPQDSRANTPKPSSQVLKRARETEAANGATSGESPPKKKTKVAPTKKKDNSSKPAASSKLKNGETVGEKVSAGKTTAKKKPGRPVGSGKKNNNTTESKTKKDDTLSQAGDEASQGSVVELE